jgi:hypothetical protein
MTRRLFEEDVRRHFAGEVTAVSGSLVELLGYTFVFNTAINEYRKLPELRTRLFSLADSGHVVNKLPNDLDVGSIEYRVVEQRLVVTDSQAFSLAINEFGPKN